MYTIKELSERTNLTINFIRKCKKKLPGVLDKYIKRGPKNRILFDDNAIIIFDKISQMKSDGLAISEIQTQLNTDFQDDQTSVKTDSNSGLLEKVFALQQQLLDEKDKSFQISEQKNIRIAELEAVNFHLKESLRLLPGKSQSGRINQIKQELKQKNGPWIWQVRKRTQLLKELSDLMGD